MADFWINSQTKTKLPRQIPDREKKTTFLLDIPVCSWEVLFKWLRVLCVADRLLYILLVWREGTKIGGENQKKSEYADSDYSEPINERCNSFLRRVKNSGGSAGFFEVAAIHEGSSLNSKELEFHEY